jgi:lipoprotein-anchoring transpeptidase ErfK/SrfK
MMVNDTDRRHIVTGVCAVATAFALAGCATNMPVTSVQGPAPPPEPEEPQQPEVQFEAPSAGMYGAIEGDRFPIPALKVSDVNPASLRRAVPYATSEAPGTIVIDPRQHYLYFVLKGGRAVRYGVGVGAEGFGWSGLASVHDKQEWPDWYPPKEMIERRPDLKKAVIELQGGLGVPGGPRNPLGARAMYLWQGNKDTLYRIHGTNEPWTIGQSVSSGCIRMINQDVIDLYGRTPVGTKVMVLQARIT